MMNDWPDHAPALGWATQRTVHVFDADELDEALSSPDGLAIIRKMIERSQFVPQALGTQTLVDLTIEHVRQGLSGEAAVQAAEAAWRKLDTTIALLEKAASAAQQYAQK